MKDKDALSWMQARAKKAREDGDDKVADHWEAEAKSLAQTLADDPDDFADPAGQGFDKLGKSDDAGTSDEDDEGFDAEALSKALDDALAISDAFDGAGEDDAESAQAAFDASEALGLAKSMDATDMVGGFVEATVKSIDALGAKLGPQAAAIDTLSKSQLAIGLFAQKSAEKVEAHGQQVAQLGDLVKSLQGALAERDAQIEAIGQTLDTIAKALRLPAQRKGATNAREMQALAKGGAGADERPAKANPNDLKKSLTALFDAATDPGRKAAIGQAINAITGGDLRPAQALLTAARA